MSHRIYLIILIVLMLVMPSAAQDDKSGVLTVSFEGVSVQYNTDIAENVAITRYPGDPVEGAGPGFSDASHITFQLYNQPYPEMMGLPFAASIRVYRIADLAQYDFMQASVDALRAIINEQPDLAQFYEHDRPLPYLPVLTHGQMLRARAQYLNGEEIRGIAYITAVQAAAEPLLSHSFFYTFQGISLDEQYYVSADFALTVSEFPSEFPDYFNIETFSANLNTYIVESVATLNAAGDASFTPYLMLLDAVIQSMSFPG